MEKFDLDSAKEELNRLKANVEAIRKERDWADRLLREASSEVFKLEDKISTYEIVKKIHKGDIYLASCLLDDECEDGAMLVLYEVLDIPEDSEDRILLKVTKLIDDSFGNYRCNPYINIRTDKFYIPAWGKVLLELKKISTDLNNELLKLLITPTFENELIIKDLILACK